MSIIQELVADLTNTIVAQREVDDAALVGVLAEPGTADDSRIRDHLMDLSAAALERQRALETCLSYAVPQTTDDAIAMLALAVSRLEIVRVSDHCDDRSEGELKLLHRCLDAALGRLAVHASPPVSLLTDLYRTGGGQNWSEKLDAARAMMNKNSPMAAANVNWDKALPECLAVMKV